MPAEPRSIIPRIKALYEKMRIAPLGAKELKKESKLAMAFCVLIMKKLNRDQLCRNKTFQKLMALVFDPEEKER